MAQFFHALFDDTRTQTVLLLVALDFLLGLVAALKLGTFRLSYVSDFLRSDVVFKVGGFAIFYAGYLYAKNVDIIIPGVDMEILMNAAWGVVVLAMAGSLLNSLKDLGLLGAAPDEVAGPDPTTPL